MSELGGVAGRLAVAIGDGEPVHWESAESLPLTDREQSLVRELHTIARLSSSRSGQSTFAPSTSLPFLWLAILVLAAAQVALALITLPIVTGFQSRGFRGYQFVLTGLFSGAAVFLAWAGSGDTRARSLGYVYLLVAAAFAQPLLAVVGMTWDGWPIRTLGGLYPEAFLPFALWQFIREFPRARPLTLFDRHASRVSAIFAVVGLALFTNSWVMSFQSFRVHSGVSAWLWQLRRTPAASSTSTWFWLIVSSLMMPSLALSIWRLRASDRDERRRVMWFVCAVGLGLAPLFVVALLRAVSPGFRAIMATPRTIRGFIDALVLVAMLSVPFTTAYAVVVHKILAVRLVIHRALQYALARYTLHVLIALPTVVPLWEGYHARERRIADVLADPRTVTAGWVSLLFFALRMSRKPLLAALDRFFVGKPIDHSDTLGEAAKAISHGRTAREVAFETAEHINHAFGASHVAVLTRRGNGYSMLCGTAPGMSADTSFPDLLREAPAVDLSWSGRLFGLLPQDDREWLYRGGFQVVARISSSQQEVAGLVAVSGRANGLPFSKADLSLLTAMLHTTGLALDRPLADDSADVTVDGESQGAVECDRCGAVGAAPSCACSASVRPASLPSVLGQKFEVIRRLGRGGMGIVYLGRDLRLDRPVALKTLPQVSGAAVEGMFSEAKTMALVDHPNLAHIYALEVWKSTPVLVVEYLPGGTLSDRLAEGPLSIAEALRTGASVADALSALHAAGILHRDVKPSNVGFTKVGVPKLLDFGVARLLGHADPEGKKAAPLPVSEQLAMSTAVAGTPRYLPPETWEGGAPNIFVDLWGTAVVVLEALVGAYPFTAKGAALFVAPSDWSRWRAALPAEVVEFLERALDRDPRRRPQSAVSLADELRSLASVPVAH